MNIQEIRQNYPQYDQVSDQELASALYEKHYKGKIEPTEFYKKIGMDWENIGGQVINPNEQPDTLANSLNVDMDKGVEHAWDRIGANVQAGYTSILGLGSSLVKIADKIGMAPEGSAQKAQTAFDEESKIYDAGEYPETAVTNFLAPALLPGTLPIKIGSKLALGKAGQYLGAAAGGAVTGATYGGLSNTPGNSPLDVWNEQGAKTGMLLGAPLGAAGQFVSNFGKNVSGYQKGAEELEKTGYKGPVLARDYGDEVLGQIKSNWMDNIIATGIRDEQLSSITPAIKELLGSVTYASEKQGSHKIGQIITGVNKKLEDESSAKWQALFSAAKENGITKIDTPLTKKSVGEFLETYGHNLEKKEFNALQVLAQAKKVDMETLNKVKGLDVWKAHQKYGKIDQLDAQNMSTALKDIYWNMSDDIGNALKGNPQLSEMRTAANEFTKGVKSIFNMENNRKLTNAISDFNENTGQLKTFINSVMKPVSGEQSKYYSGALGKEYTDEVSKLAFNKTFLSSFDSEANGLNLNKFFKGIQEADASGLLKNDTVKAISVLEKHFNKIQAIQEGAKNSAAKNVQQILPYAQGAAVTGGYMAGGLPGAALATSAIFLGPKLLGLISKASPLKNLLISASNVYGKNPNLTEHLMNLVGKKLSQAGVSMYVSADGVKLDQEKK